jgi:hypothetical protein
MAVFDRLDRLTSRAVDRVNAIPFILTPWISTPNGRGRPEPGQPEIRGRGVFDDLAAEYGVQLGVRRSYREANDLRALQVGSDPQISIDIQYFAGRMPRQGDLVSLPTKPELPDYQVISAQPDGQSRVVLMLAGVPKDEEEQP